MKLLDEIIEILSSEEGKLSDALVKTKVLLHKIGQKELVTWVNNELEGYSTNDSLPDYRILRSQVLVDASNMAYQFNAHPIPLAHLDDDQRESLETARMSQSLAVLEQYAGGSSSTLRATIPVESYGLLEEGLDASVRIQRAWCEISTVSITQIITQVKSRLLDFVLGLSEKLPEELNDREIKEKANSIDAKNLFNNAIFGDNATILVGNGSTQSVLKVNVKGDIEGLSNLLLENGISQDDIDFLKDAIEKDKDLIDQENREFGPAVKSWLQSMLSKAVDTSWKIELGVASSLLATALNNFYGWF